MNQSAMEKFNRSFEEKIATLVEKTELSNKTSREEFLKNLKEISDQNRQVIGEMKDSLGKSLKDFADSFDKNVKAFNDLQREKFSDLDKKQGELILKTEEKLEKMRETVDEKLQKTLNERIGQSFETVSKQLLAVQEGLGEMKNLAQDVGGLKKVLGNVKMRGGIGEVQLEMLLEQILAPEQFVKNYRPKESSDKVVEFAIRLPGKDDAGSFVYLPIDAKFNKDAYDALLEAYDSGDAEQIRRSSKSLEDAIRKNAKDIRDKYLDPPNTTDFAIMFLPFEGIFAEVVRRSSLLEEMQRDYKVIITGPTTIAAILNSLQMGFRTLALQKRSSEVWNILGAVKTEFEKFGGLLQKAQKNIHTAGNTLEELIGKRTKAINRRLRDVQGLPAGESSALLPGMENEEGTEEDDDEKNDQQN
ncbi:MAG TPA: DNA recombination protein RmuC [Bacteroidia bacterium]|nr:DNA recombination protein RmuC [Bacteroidia bacterium]